MTRDILIVDVDSRIREVIRFALEDAGMQVAEAEDGQDALRQVAARSPDLVVLDIGMPHVDGFETCKALRKTSDVPIMFLTARDDEIDRVLGFQLGGDDYVKKPFSPRELVLRIKAILSRVQAASQPLPRNRRHGDLSMDLAGCVCRLGPGEMQLTAIEFGVLAALLEHPEQLHTRAQLIAAVYGANTHLSGRTIDSHIRNIRKKAADLGYRELIKTVHGFGVKLGPCKA